MLENDQERIAALGLLMGEIFSVHRISRHYEYQRRRQQSSDIPVIVCGVHSFGPQDPKRESLSFGDYFMGSADDIGVSLEHVKVLLLPRASVYMSGSTSREETILFPNVFSYQRLGEPELDFSHGEEARMSRMTEGLSDDARNQSGSANLAFLHPRSYFNGLLLADEVLRHVDAQADQGSV